MNHLKSLIFLLIASFILCTTESNDDVVLGIDNIDEYMDIFQGMRVGLLTNPTGLNKNYESTIDILNEKVDLRCLFSPEHGIRGEIEDQGYSPEEIDERTGLTVYSLYGHTRKPNKHMMDQIDVMVVDLQDIGARFYTYIYTMALSMQACRQFNKIFVVLDRPNPVGNNIDGNLLNEKHSSSIGMYPILTRHGMTIGEIATMFNYEFEIYCKLKIVKMKNYDRYKYYDELNLPWINLSPNIPTIQSADVYTATGHFEGVNLSEGRGTTKPFEYVGAPFIDPFEYANKLNNLTLPGVHFRPVYFKPTASKYQGQRCGGVQVHVIDRKIFKSVQTGYAMIYTAKELYPKEVILKERLKKLTGVDYVYDMTYSLKDLFDVMVKDTRKFDLMKSKYLLY